MDAFQGLKSVCCSCGQAGDGKWSLCPACRQRLAERQADHLAGMLVSDCVGLRSAVALPRARQTVLPAVREAIRPATGRKRGGRPGRAGARRPAAQSGDAVGAILGGGQRAGVKHRPTLRTQQRGKGKAVFQRKGPGRPGSGQEYT